MVWVEIVKRFELLARRLAKRNGVSRHVTTQHHNAARLCRGINTSPSLSQHQSGAIGLDGWAGGTGAAAPPFDLVITESVDDGLLGDGLLRLARRARATLLKPAGKFLPARATVWVAAAEVRTGTVSGFDLRGFNAFRSNAGVCYGLSEVC